MKPINSNHHNHHHGSSHCIAATTTTIITKQKRIQSLSIDSFPAQLLLLDTFTFRRRSFLSFLFPFCLFPIELITLINWTINNACSFIENRLVFASFIFMIIGMGLAFVRIALTHAHTHKYLISNTLKHNGTQNAIDSYVHHHNDTDDDDEFSVNCY